MIDGLVLADGQPLAINRVEGGLGYAQRGIRVRLRKIDDDACSWCGRTGGHLSTDECPNNERKTGHGDAK